MISKFINIILSLLVIVAFFQKVNAQQLHQTISTAGGNATGSGGSVSFTVGQLFYHTVLNEKGSIQEGIQHPFNIKIIDAINENRDINISATVFPNPASESLVLKIDNIEQLRNKLSFQLIDVNGKSQLTERISNTETNIEVQFLSHGIYFLRILKTDAKRENPNKNIKEVLKTFRIIKN